MNRLSMLLAASLTLSPALSLAASPRLTADEAGKITAELEAKEKEIRAEYGNRTNKEMSRDERKEMEAKIKAARGEVLEQHGTTDRSYEVGMARLGGSVREMEAVKSEHAKKLEADKAAREKGEAKAGASEVKVQRGFDDNNPVTVDGEEGVQVQQGGGEDGIEIPLGTGAEAGGQ